MISSQRQSTERDTTMMSDGSFWNTSPDNKLPNNCNNPIETLTSPFNVHHSPNMSNNTTTTSSRTWQFYGDPTKDLKATFTFRDTATRETTTMPAYLINSTKKTIFVAIPTKVLFLRFESEASDGGPLAALATAAINTNKNYSIKITARIRLYTSSDNEESLMRAFSRDSNIYTKRHRHGEHSADLADDIIQEIVLANDESAPDDVTLRFDLYFGNCVSTFIGNTEYRFGFSIDEVPGCKYFSAPFSVFSKPPKSKKSKSGQPFNNNNSSSNSNRKPRKRTAMTTSASIASSSSEEEEDGLSSMTIAEQQQQQQQRLSNKKKREDSLRIKGEGEEEDILSLYCCWRCHHLHGCCQWCTSMSPPSSPPQLPNAIQTQQPTMITTPPPIPISNPALHLDTIWANMQASLLAAKSRFAAASTSGDHYNNNNNGNNNDNDNQKQFTALITAVTDMANAFLNPTNKKV